jgi:hypothetical protein
MRLVVLGLAVLAVVSTPAIPKPRSGVKWIPLNQVQNGAPKRTEPTKSPAATAQPEAASPVTSPSVEARTSPTTIANVASPPTAGALQLTCLGSGTANKLAIATVNSNSNVFGSVGTTPFSGYGSGNATVMGQRQQGFREQVDIRLFSGDDRIRMPRTMLPPIHGGNGGWFKLKDVVADTRSIKGKAALSFMNNPNIFIDRVTGTISISGRAGDYTGQCQVIDASAAPKF